MDPALYSVDPTKSLDMCPIWDGLLPSDEVFLELMIQSDLLMDFDSVVVKSNTILIIESNIYHERSSNVRIFESPIEQQVINPIGFDSYCIFFDSHNVESVPTDPISYVNFRFPLYVDLIDYKSLVLGTT